MKKIIFSLLATTGAFASPLNSPEGFEVIPDFSDSISKQAFFYVRFSTAEGDLMDVSSVHPGLGIGYRRLAGNGAVDISVSGLGYSQDSGREFFWTAPKTSYIQYINPSNEKSFYFGGGLSWGGIKRKQRNFIGIIPNAMFGYEFFHKNSVLGFAELTLSQPAIAVYTKGAFPGPIAEVSIGAGF